MLQAPHLSRVCGHGHIKKFWLMQTQKENQACENKSSLLFPSPTTRPTNRGSIKGLDSSPWASSPSSHNAGYADASVTPSKHSRFTCAQSLSPTSESCKESPLPSSQSTGSSEAVVNMDCLTRGLEGVESPRRSLDGEVHPKMPSPRIQPLTVASEHYFQGSSVATAEADPAEPSSFFGHLSNEEPMSMSMEQSPDSHASYSHARPVQRPLNPTSCNLTFKAEDRTSPSASKELKSSLSYSGVSSLPNAVDFGFDKARADDARRTHEMMDPDLNRSAQATLVQHPAPKACMLCGTTKTPMWRSGPQGPKSLCNACGIRFKKYRSFPGQSESPELVSSSLAGPVAPIKSLARPLKRKQSYFPSCDPPRQQKVCMKPTVADAVVHQQLKRSKWHQLVVKREHDELKEFIKDSSPWCAHAGPPSLKKIYGCFPFQSKFKKLSPIDDHLSITRVFAKDEEYAAVLLMHLSCGLVY